MIIKSLSFFCVATALVHFTTCASAQTDPSPETPQARACMAKNGFTYEQWRAYAVGPAKAAAYRRCVTKANAKYSSGKVLDSEPPRRALKTGQVVRVSCGNGKVRTVTGGSSGQPRIYGACK